MTTPTERNTELAKTGLFEDLPEPSVAQVQQAQAKAFITGIGDAIRAHADAVAANSNGNDSAAWVIPFVQKVAEPDYTQTSSAYADSDKVYRRPRQETS